MACLIDCPEQQSNNFKQYPEHVRAVPDKSVVQPAQ